MRLCALLVSIKQELSRLSSFRNEFLSLKPSIWFGSICVPVQEEDALTTLMAVDEDALTTLMAV